METEDLKLDLDSFQKYFWIFFFLYHISQNNTKHT